MHFKKETWPNTIENVQRYSFSNLKAEKQYRFSPIKIAKSKMIREGAREINGLICYS